MTDTPISPGMGRVVRRMRDGAGKPLAGVEATFRPRVASVLGTGEEIPSSYHAGVVVTSDSGGWLAQGEGRFVELIGTDDPARVPVDWQWEVSYFHPATSIDTQVFSLPVGETVDLVKVADVGTIPGTIPVVTDETRVAAQAAADDARAAADDALQAVAAVPQAVGDELDARGVPTLSPSARTGIYMIGAQP
ncbi:hypothetical protein [Georgenia wangjunii]|uniref:hypothetical protein n=1 Tax=Georgenia wangjunii TaxID=3117730 RepID=UPI002F266E84